MKIDDQEIDDRLALKCFVGVCLTVSTVFAIVYLGVIGLVFIFVWFGYLGMVIGD